MQEPIYCDGIGFAVAGDGKAIALCLTQGGVQVPVAVVAVPVGDVEMLIEGMRAAAAEARENQDTHVATMEA